MVSQLSRRVNGISHVVIIALLVLLVGCGSGVTTNTTVQAGSAHPQTTEGVKASDTDGLHIQFATGIECPKGNGPLQVPDIPPGGALVLATNRFSYDRGEIQQIIAYLQALLQSNPLPVQDGETSLPTSLRWAAGAPGCTTNLQITNVGSNTIQIPRVGVRLAQSPQINTYQYHLIDSCTLLSLAECGCGTCGASGPSLCGTFYYAEIHMETGEKNSVFAAAPAGNGVNNQYKPISCGELTLEPGQTTDLILDFYPPPPPNSNLSYSIIPEITLVTSHGKKILTFPQLRNTIVFANQSQFSCYGLQGYTFIKELFVLGTAQPYQNCI